MSKQLHSTPSSTRSVTLKRGNPTVRRFLTLCSLTSGISPTILLEECWLETTRATLLRLILLSWQMRSQGSTSIMGVRLLRNALLLIVTRGTFLVASMPHFFCSFSKENRAQMIQSFLLLALTWLPCRGISLLLRPLTAIHLIIFCGLKTVWHALSIYLHHLCLIFLAGMDFVFQWPIDEITGRYQFHDPTEGVEPDEEEHVVYPPVQEETLTPAGKSLPLDRRRDLPLPRGRIRGLRCTHQRTHTTHA